MNDGEKINKIQEITRLIKSKEIEKSRERIKRIRRQYRKSRNKSIWADI